MLSSGVTMGWNAPAGFPDASRAAPSCRSTSSTSQPREQRRSQTAVPASPASAKGPGDIPSARPEVDVLTLESAIQPISSEVIRDAIGRAEKAKREALVIRLDTPGGLDTSMRDIIKRILVSEVPVIVYVSPSGSRAASAGTFLAMAAHVAAMAPGTSIGAATPVNVGGGDVAKDMAAKVKTAKQVAPTRPHPGAPHSELFHKIAGPGVGLVDRLKDLITKRATK